MREISLGLGTAREAEVLGHRAATEAPQLRKDEPHPVARLGAGGKLGAHTLVDRSLCDDEALEVERHLHDADGPLEARTGSSRSDVLVHHPVADEAEERLPEGRGPILLESEVADPGEAIAAH